MTFLGTQMHMLTFIITIFECAMLFFVMIYHLLRPSDKSRIRYVKLLVLLIIYNVFSGFFPDPNIQDTYSNSNHFSLFRRDQCFNVFRVLYLQNF